MDINTLFIEPHQGALDDVVIHVPFRLIETDGCVAEFSDPALDLEMMFKEVDGLDMVQTRPVGQYALRVVVAKTAHKADEVFACALLFVIGRMDITGIDELQLKFPDSTSRKIEHRLGKILRQLAREEWDEGHEELLLAYEVRTMNCRSQVSHAERQVANNNAEVDELDATLMTASNSLRNAQRALKRAHEAAYDEPRLVAVTARLQSAKEEVEKTTSKLKCRLDMRDALDQNVARTLANATQNDIEFHKLSEAKRPKFEVWTEVRRGTVTLVVVG